MASSDTLATTSQFAAIGLDLGGSSIKYGLIGTDGKLVEETFSQATTPEGAHPDDVAQVMARIISQLQQLTGDELADVPVGITVPGIVIDGVVHSAANIDKAWVGFTGKQPPKRGNKEAQAEATMRQALAFAVISAVTAALIQVLTDRGAQKAIARFTNKV